MSVGMGTSIGIVTDTGTGAGIVRGKQTRRPGQGRAPATEPREHSSARARLSASAYPPPPPPEIPRAPSQSALPARNAATNGAAVIGAAAIASASDAVATASKDAATATAAADESRARARTRAPERDPFKIGRSANVHENSILATSPRRTTPFCPAIGTTDYQEKRIALPPLEQTHGLQPQDGLRRE